MKKAPGSAMGTGGVSVREEGGADGQRWARTRR